MPSATPAAAQSRAKQNSNNNKDQEMTESAAQRDSAPRAATTSASSSVDSGVTPLLASVPDRDLPFRHKWTLWYNQPNQPIPGQPWVNNVVDLCNFSTQQEFWSIFHLMKPPASGLAKETSYHVFRHGVRPTWEDEQNANGGKWLVTYTLAKPPEAVNQAWKDTILAMCGGRLDYVNDEERIALARIIKQKIIRPVEQWTQRDHDDFAYHAAKENIPLHVLSEYETIGCVINVRKKETRLSLWMRRQPGDAHGRGGDVTVAIGLAWKALVATGGEKIGFMQHQELWARASNRKSGPPPPHLFGGQNTQAGPGQRR